MFKIKILSNIIENLKERLIIIHMTLKFSYWYFLAYKTIWFYISISSPPTDMLILPSVRLHKDLPFI